MTNPLCVPEATSQVFGASRRQFDSLSLSLLRVEVTILPDLSLRYIKTPQRLPQLQMPFNNRIRRLLKPHP